MTPVQDLLATLRLAPMVAETARWDTARRYRQTPLGPFLISLAQCAVMTFTAFVLGRVLQQGFSGFLVYVLLSNALWMFIHNALATGTHAYMHRPGRLMAQETPLLLVPATHLASITVQFLHDLVPPLLLLALMQGMSWTWLLALPALALWLVTGLAVITITAMLGTRQPLLTGTITATAAQCLMLVTPVLWPVGQLGPFAWVQCWNPVFSYLEIMRAPLFGHWPEWWSWPAALVWTAILITAATGTYRLSAARLVIWAGSR